MSDDWNVGDLAVRVERHHDGLTCGPPMGLIVRVIGVVAQAPGWRWGGLVIEGYPSPHSTQSWCEPAFRKIRPDVLEACETEFVTLLKRSKQRVGA